MDDQEYEEKRDYSAEKRQSMADQGFALPDGSYPIKDEADLRNAIQAFGRAKDKEATKAHIKKRAHKLGLDDLVPENWNDSAEGKDDAKSDPEEADVEDKDEDSGEEKGILRINGDGEMTQCAKGVADGCGYKAGDKVCGKCGAMAVMTKAAGDADFGVGMEREMDEEAPDEDQALSRQKKKKPVGTDGSEDSADTEDELVRQAEEMKKKKRVAKMQKMGVKDASAGAFLCAFDRKVLPEGAEPCEGCSGGCFPVKGGADLLEIEVKAEEMYDATVVDSGYSDQYDKFVVDLRRKDGRLIEAIFSGAGEDEGWHPIPESALAMGDEVIGGDEAIELALGAVQGKALSVGVQMFDGSVAYCVEVDGEDGYSYDVFVDTEGKVLALDQWEYETSSIQPAEQKDAATAEIEAALLEFEALRTEEELREQGLI